MPASTEAFALPTSKKHFFFYFGNIFVDPSPYTINSLIAYDENTSDSPYLPPSFLMMCVCTRDTFILQAPIF